MTNQSRHRKIWQSIREKVTVSTVTYGDQERMIRLEGKTEEMNRREREGELLTKIPKQELGKYKSEATLEN